jgi:hypothetical protein
MACQQIGLVPQRFPLERTNPDSVHARTSTATQWLANKSLLFQRDHDLVSIPYQDLVGWTVCFFFHSRNAPPHRTLRIMSMAANWDASRPPKGCRASNREPPLPCPIFGARRGSRGPCTSKWPDTWNKSFGWKSRHEPQSSPPGRQLPRWHSDPTRGVP